MKKINYKKQGPEKSIGKDIDMTSSTGSGSRLWLIALIVILIFFGLMMSMMLSNKEHTGRQIKANEDVVIIDQQTGQERKIAPAGSGVSRLRRELKEARQMMEDFNLFRSEFATNKDVEKLTARVKALEVENKILKERTEFITKDGAAFIFIADAAFIKLYNGSDAIVRYTDGKQYIVKKGENFKGYNIVDITPVGVLTDKGWIR